MLHKTINWKSGFWKAKCISFRSSKELLGEMIQCDLIKFWSWKECAHSTVSSISRQCAHTHANTLFFFAFYVQSTVYLHNKVNICWIRKLYKTTTMNCEIIWKKIMFLHLTAYAEYGWLWWCSNIVLKSDQFLFYREVASVMYRTKSSPVHRQIVGKRAILFGIVSLVIILFRNTINFFNQSW